MASAFLLPAVGGNEYLYATINGNGRPCVYSLARAEETDVAGLRGLTNVAEIKQRLKEKAVG